MENIDLTLTSDDEDQHEQAKDSDKEGDSAVFDVPSTSDNSFQQAPKSDSDDPIIKSQVSLIKKKLKKENLSAVDMKTYSDGLQKLYDSAVSNGLKNSITKLLNYLKIRLKKVQSPKENRASFIKASKFIQQISQKPANSQIYPSRRIITSNEQDDLPTPVQQGIKRSNNDSLPHFPKKPGRFRRRSKVLEGDATLPVATLNKRPRGRPKKEKVVQKHNAPAFGPSTSRTVSNQMMKIPAKSIPPKTQLESMLLLKCSYPKAEPKIDTSDHKRELKGFDADTPQPHQNEELSSLFTPVHIQALAVRLNLNVHDLTEAVFKSFDDANKIIDSYQKWRQHRSV